jgi:hypothetical protein
MKHSSFVAAAAFAVILGLCGCGLKKDTKAAETEIERFHQHWNADEFKAIYDEAHPAFRNKSAEDIVATFTRVKGVYGPFKSATKRSWGFNSDKGVSDIKLKYDSTYDRGSAVEAFVYRMVGGKASLLSYEIMSLEAAKEHEAEEKAEREAKRKSDDEKRASERDARKDAKKPNG